MSADSGCLETMINPSGVGRLKGSARSIDMLYNVHSVEAIQATLDDVLGIAQQTKPIPDHPVHRIC